MTDLSPGPSGMGGSPGPISLNRLRGRAVLARGPDARATAGR